MSSLDEELDRLYRLPLGEFVQARNEIAAALKKSGDVEAAKRVRELPKPSASAWAVNQLYWTARPELDELITVSDRHRRAQQAALAGDGSELSDAERERRRGIDEAIRRIRYILAESGQAAAEPLMRRITTTLEALASYGSGNPNPMRGRLSEDLESPGFGALSSLAPPPTAPPSVAELLAKDILKGEEILAEARAALSKATARAELTAAALDAAQAALTRAADEAGQGASELEEARALVAELEEKRRSRLSESGEAAD
ncbi:MAG: hypothetical protein ACRD1Z_22310 [Vicinamibacteria bacterium]